MLFQKRFTGFMILTVLQSLMLEDSLDNVKRFVECDNRNPLSVILWILRQIGERCLTAVCKRYMAGTRTHRSIFCLDRRNN